LLGPRGLASSGDGYSISYLVLVYSIQFWVSRPSPSSRATTVQVVPVWLEELASFISSRCPRRAYRSVGHSQDLAACALCNLVFLAKQAVKPRRPAFLCRHEGPVCAIHREQIRHHLASNRNGRLAVIGGISR
jgi:hypothetical protein